MTWQSEKQIEQSVLSKHKELKSLQKEIDEANDEQDFIMQSTWGSKKPLTSELSTRHEHLNDLKYDKQSKIKQIIEEL